ncbi:MAG: adenosine deaminase [Clostridia bacterium]|nr:adenosine deaminase [Clostridia bacterium]
MPKYPFPKCDLHLHLDGSMLAETAWELAKERNIPLPAETLEGFRNFITVTADCRSVNEYLARFEMPLSILQDAASLTRVTEELIALLASQGLAYAEIRFAPQLHTRAALTQRDAIEAVLEGRKRGLAANPGIQTGIILCTMCVGSEQANMEANLETVRLAAQFIPEKTGVVAIDLAGAEGIVPLKNFAPVFDLAKELGVPFTCHAGDSQGPDTVRDALDFGTKRIGHGHHIFNDEALCARAIRDGVTLEICPTSNIQCETQPSYGEHPLKRLIAMGMSCTINTDNMILSGIDLDTEYDHCLTEMGLTCNDLIRCNINSVKASFLPAEEKTPLIERLMGYLESAE